MRLKLFFLTLTMISLFSSAQVKLQTGAADFSLPLYSYSDGNNRLGYNISLNYIDGNGLKPSEIASSIGTGWSLNAGGVITRIQHGEPDDQKQDLPYSTPVDPYGTTDYENNYYPNGYLYSEFNAWDAVHNGAAYTPLYWAPKSYMGPKEFIADREQDMFAFSFNGREGMFIIGKNGIIRTIGDSKLQITKVGSAHFTNNVRTTISEFDIVDETGIKYVFKDLELSEIIKYDQTHFQNQSQLYNVTDIFGRCDNWFSCKRITVGRGINQFVVSKWFLSEIINPLTNSKVTFNYEDYNIDLDGNTLFDKSVTDGSASYSMTREKIKGVTKRLTSINSSSSEKVVFNYSPYLRLDVPTDKALESIKIYFNDELKYGWKFSFAYSGVSGITVPIDYVPSSNDVDKPYFRLFLLSAQKIGKNGRIEMPYTFNYYSGGSVTNNGYDLIPARFSFKQDFWGYSNTSLWGIPYEPGDDLDGILSNASQYSAVFDNPSRRQPSNKFAQIGILSSIQYPAGGTLSFEYEQNNALDNSNNLVNVGGVRVKSATLYDGIDHAKDVLTEYLYVLENGLSSGWGYEAPIFTLSSATRIHKCGDAKYAGLDLRGFAGMVLPSMLVNSILHGTTITAGVVAWNFLLYVAEQLIINYLVALLTPDYKDFTTTFYSADGINRSNMLPLQYSRVVVKNSQTGSNNGATTYEFTNKSDQDFLVPTIAFPYANKQRAATWVYGLPKKISYKDNNNILKKEIVNRYNHYVTWIFDQNFASQKWATNFKDYDCFTSYGLLNNQGTNYVNSDVYYPYSGRSELAESKEYTYNSAGGYVLKTVNYTYSPSHYQLSQISSSNSKGEAVKTTLKYAGDYGTPSGSFLQTMLDRNIIGIPVGSFSYITKSGSDYLVSGNVTEFAAAPNGDLKPINNYIFRSSIPLATNVVQLSSDTWNPNANSSYFKIAQNFSYNSSGQLVQLNTDQGINATILDYDKRFTVATVSNASSNEIAYTSFEAESQGNWNYDDTKIRTDIVPTGKKYYLVEPNSSISCGVNLNSSQSYVLSYWSKGGAISPIKSRYVNGNVIYSSAGSLIKSYTNSVTGWTYYEYLITNTDAFALDNGALWVAAGVTYPTIFLDELRLYPSTARMSTATYDPLVGKTSECDANGRITYYEYDDLGRLQFVRDENKNIIKMYEYNYQR